MKTLYSGGLFFDGSRNLLENHGVQITGERISSIAPIGDFEGYSGKIIDTSVGTILPGLIATVTSIQFILERLIQSPVC